MTTSTLPAYTPEALQQTFADLRHVCHSIPFSGDVALAMPPIEDFADVANFLTKLAERIAAFSATATADRAELDELRRQRDAMRKFLGTA